ncbi:hypothetical protein [Pseudoduganella violacea]|uniref:Uncharacterized protein n=1 Tax=Pseudoduganella violacea TaxID=1715466 RepID=A0A7W5FT00_9BURK|nr:hypothetical protein [Pseudoduganella violacea]MBB3118071.1 hypothetical protein [Pseudoduganella violacea]
MNPHMPLPPPRRLALLLVLIMGLLLLLFKADHMKGDSVEYTLATIAMANHGTPAIRMSDIEQAKQLAPERAEIYEILAADLRANKQVVYAAYVRGRGGDVYTVHFFGYSALAVLPYKLLQAAGLPPLKCFQVLNLTMVLVLALCLYRLFRNTARAAWGTALFMLCGGALYWNWSSPECLSAAALLGALALYASGAPLRAGLLAGLAAWQNPTILAFLGFAPLIKLCLDYQPGRGLAAALRQALAPRQLLGLGLALVLIALPPLFNLWQYGVPNIIVKLFSNRELVTVTRLVSFFFDLNQGLLIGIPAVLALLALWMWRGAPQRVLLLGACASFTLALILPALAVLNWNSGAAGMMRYAFWSSMPLLFALLWRLQQQARWPRRLAVGLLLAQGLCMVNALSYSYVQFSPLARLVLRYAPNWYHPEPEIFAERSGNNDDYINPERIYAYPRDGAPIKHLYNARHPGIEDHLCGQGMKLAPGNAAHDSVHGWRYLDGALACVAADPARGQRLRVEQFRLHNTLQLGQGWSGLEYGGGAWDGVWSLGARSQLRLQIPAALSAPSVTLHGNYFNGNTRTRVLLDGKDMGWVQLEQPQPLPLPAEAVARGSVLIELRHEQPQRPSPQDTRLLAVFLNEVTLR